MDFELTIKTPGQYLSTYTLWSVINQINRDFERTLRKSIQTEFPKVSSRQLSKLYKGKVNFYIKDVRKGSWELVLIGSVGGIIGKIFYDLGIDYVKSSNQWQEFKKRVNGPSKTIAKDIKDRLENEKTLGPYIVERKTVEIEISENGIPKLIYKAVLEQRKEQHNLLLDTEAQIEALIQEIEKNRKNNTKRIDDEHSF
jgi:N12 class adenine-specific DNA methylase